MIKIDKEQKIEDFIGKIVYYVDNNYQLKEVKIGNKKRNVSLKKRNTIEEKYFSLIIENKEITGLLYKKKIKDEYFIENRDFRIYAVKEEAIDYKIKEIETEIQSLNKHKEYLENLK